MTDQEIEALMNDDNFRMTAAERSAAAERILKEPFFREVLANFQSGARREWEDSKTFDPVIQHKLWLKYKLSVAFADAFVAAIRTGEFTKEWEERKKPKILDRMGQAIRRNPLIGTLVKEG